MVPCSIQNAGCENFEISINWLSTVFASYKILMHSSITMHQYICLTTMSDRPLNKNETALWLYYKKNKGV